VDQPGSSLNQRESNAGGTDSRPQTEASHRSRVVLAYRVGAAVASRVPAPIGRVAVRLAALVARRLLPDRVAQVRLHQQRLARNTLTPQQLEERVDANLRSYCNYWFQALRLIGVDSKEIAQHIEIDGQQYSDAALAAGHGAICVMPHVGLWDLGGAWLGSRYPLSVVAERLDPPELFDWFVSMRASNGMEVVALGDEDAGQRLLSRLRSGGFIGLLTDRDINHDGVEVMFFGERTTMSPGPATLALRTGAPLLPTAVFDRPGKRALGVIRPPIQYERAGRLRDDVAALTQVIASTLEALISEAPEQWHVLQPVWPSDPGYSKR
jgi:phosphatidylinositol dimannoside acyltransferase